MAARSRDPGPNAIDNVAQARTRARRRLIGAVVLLGVGIIAFPLVFETRPRPIPVDLPIEIPRKESAPPLATPVPPRTAATPASVPSAAVATPAPPEPRAEAPREPASPVAATPAAPPASANNGAKARALLEGRPAPAAAAAAESGRFVVQVGAFADAAAARETRQKVEKLGLKTYTQVAETAAGSRTRVRIGPFASREEAERVLGRAKAAGIDGVVLTL